MLSCVEMAGQTTVRPRRRRGKAPGRLLTSDEIA
jgi:hypothetical protein